MGGLRITFDNENVYVSYGAGEWEVQPLNNSWLQLIGCLESGKMIVVKDEREILQDHQHHMSFTTRCMEIARRSERYENK